LVLTKNILADGSGTITIEDLPVVTPKCSIGLKKNAISHSNKMWETALNDVGQNMVTNNYALRLHF